MMKLKSQSTDFHIQPQRFYVYMWPARMTTNHEGAPG